MHLPSVTPLLITCFLTIVPGEWVEIPAISTSNFDENNSKTSYSSSYRPGYNKTYVFERVVLRQSPTRETEPTIKLTTDPPSRLSIRNNFYKNEDLLEMNHYMTEDSSGVLKPPKVLSSTVPPQKMLSTLEQTLKTSPQFTTTPTSKISSTTPLPPKIISSTPSPPPSGKTEKNRVKESSNLSFQGLPGLLFTTRMKDIIMGVHNTLSRQPSQTIRGKLKYLEEIKNNLLKNIWERSRILWRGNSIDRSDARSMSYFPSGGGEGPLITIALLTFAVFLIKIVQQFIQGLQGAAAANSVQMQAAQAGGGGRVKRWADDRLEHATTLLHYMERYKFHNEL
ncbi:uncharacterized protein LOC120350761 isoform X2 [Nilaparvata lugens]|uniref:uncharacterized protein LOC120350761 isoform X2 n=1 Tax=Nilaparvata lugens TaxID=108931 RepID=UPI00193D3BD0|nr:uncharacterized protein LOC120350761 isoform X2 [Nilaparvata lugens]